MKKKFILFITLVLFLGKNTAQTPLSQHFMGINAWMPDTIGTHIYYGKMLQNTHWSQVKSAQPRLVRIGGIACDEAFFTNYQILRLIDSIRSAGAEPLVQVPLWAGGFSASNAAQIVQFLNITHNKNIIYFSIGNEPNYVYNTTAHGFSSGNYTPPQYEAHVKAFSAAMKATDPTIKIVAGEMAWYDYTWVNALLGGANDISGKDAATGRDWIDYFTFHTYPFGSTTPTRADVVNSLTTFDNNLAHLVTKINAANATGNRANALKFGITEININWQNPVGDGVAGVGANSFLGAQWLAHAYAKAANRGASFVCLWSIAEGGDGSRTDIGFLSHTTGNKKPLYYHFDLISKQLRDTVYTTTSNLSSCWVAAAKMTDGWAIIASNTHETTDEVFSLRFNSTPSVYSNNLKINVLANINKEIFDTLPRTATVVYFFSPQGHLRSKITYKQGDAAPVFKTYTPTQPKKVFAHYLPWFDTNLQPFGSAPRSGWCQNGTGCSDNSIKHYTYTPLIGEYSQFDTAVLQYHLRMLWTARSDGFVINLTPTSAYQMRIFKLLCDEALKMKANCSNFDTKFIISYDNSSTSLPLSIQADFQILKDSFFGKSAYQDLIFRDNITNQPVFLTWSETNREAYRSALKTVFGEDTMLHFARNAVAFDLSDGNFEWIGYLTNDQNNTSNWGDAYYNDMDWIMARQDESNRVTTLRHINPLKIMGVYAGFDDRNVPSFWNGGNDRFLARDVTAGETMQLTWQKALNYTPRRLGGNIDVGANIVQINTWNDFPEGTNIEPSAELGYRAVQTSRKNAAIFKNQSISEAQDSMGVYAAYAIYQAQKAGRISDANNAIAQFCNSDFNAAYTTAQGVLAAQIIDFKGFTNKNNHNTIEWFVNTEKNTQAYILEKSENGQSFSAIATILAQDKNAYRFDDTNPYHSNYYRLKIMDNKNNSHYSKIILLYNKENTIKLSPNPATDVLFIENAHHNIIEIINNLGQSVLYYNDFNDNKINIAALPNGIYYLKTNNRVFKFVKK